MFRIFERFSFVNTEYLHVLLCQNYQLYVSQQMIKLIPKKISSQGFDIFPELSGSVVIVILKKLALLCTISSPSYYILYNAQAFMFVFF